MPPPSCTPPCDVERTHFFLRQSPLLVGDERLRPLDRGLTVCEAVEPLAPSTLRDKHQPLNHHKERDLELQHPHTLDPHREPAPVVLRDLILSPPLLLLPPSSCYHFGGGSHATARRAALVPLALAGCQQCLLHLPYCLGRSGDVEDRLQRRGRSGHEAELPIDHQRGGELDRRCLDAACDLELLDARHLRHGKDGVGRLSCCSFTERGGRTAFLPVSDKGGDLASVGHVV